VRMRRDSIFGFDLALFACSLALLVIGVLSVYSSGVTPTGQSVSITHLPEYLRQIIWVGTGLVLMFVATFFDYTSLKPLALYIYGAAVLLVLATFLFGRVVHGARAWIGAAGLGIQPSEFAKIATILVLAAYFTGIGRTLGPLVRLLGAFAIVLVPVGVILAQPDLGTALVYFPILLIMALVAGIPLRYLVFIVGTGALTIVLSVLPSYERIILNREYPVFGFLNDPSVMVWILGASVLITGLGIVGHRVLKRRRFGWVAFGGAILTVSLLGAVLFQRVVKDYQIMRFMVFLDPNVDPLGAGWNIVQSQTAVGSGGFLGKGYLGGTQSHLRYLPEQSTDFIFSIIAEEWGFWGGMVVFALFVVVLLRGIRIASLAKEDFGMLACTGVVAMIFFHAAMNAGVAMGVMPVTGIPLYLLSYGGSSTWTALIGLGLMQSVYMRRY
jgi:rod shape determining protein RodA